MIYSLVNLFLGWQISCKDKALAFENMVPVIKMKNALQ